MRVEPATLYEALSEASNSESNVGYTEVTRALPETVDNDRLLLADLVLLGRQA